MPTAPPPALTRETSTRRSIAPRCLLIERLQREVFVSFGLLLALSVVAISCQSKGRLPDSNDVAAAKKVTTENSPRNTLQGSWPGAYPGPTSLKGLGRVALRVHADRGIPSDRISSGPFGVEIERLTLQELRKAGITLTNEDDAEAVLNLDLYLVCQADHSSCGYHTDLELEQWVQLHRDTSISVAATTWSNSYTNTISGNQVNCCLPDQLTVDVRSLLGAFVRDFHKANGR